MSEQQAAVAKSRMPKELKAKWLEALRSGKWKQGKRILYNPTDDSYCCLGVLQRLVGPVEQAGLPSPEWSQSHQCYNAELDRLSFAPIIDGRYSVAGANDRGQSFALIADAIETHVEGV